MTDDATLADYDEDDPVDPIQGEPEDYPVSEDGRQDDEATE